MHIKIKLSSDAQKLQIASLTENHNHTIDKESFHSLPKQRKLDSEEKNEAENLLQLNCNKKLLQSYLQNKTGKPIQLRDISNLKSCKQCSVTNLENVLKILDVDDNIAQIAVDKNNSLLGIYYQTPWTQSCFAGYPDAWLTKEEIQRPVLFLVDGNRSHMSLELSKFCDQNEIILYALPPNATHLLQPADVAVFKPLKEYWRQEVREWQTENENKVVTKADFCPIFHKVLQHPNMCTNMKNGFKACGLYPFNPGTVNYKKCVPNILEELSIMADIVQDE